MANITVYIPKKYKYYLEKIISYGLFTSKSEAVRCCIEEMIPRFQYEINCIEDILKKENVTKLIKFLKERGFTITRTFENYQKVVRPKKKEPLGNKFWKEVKVVETGETIKIPVGEDELEITINSSKD